MGTIHELLDELRLRIDELVAQGHREALGKVTTEDADRATKDYVTWAQDEIDKWAIELRGDTAAEALDAAGLLRTGLEQRAMDACVKYAQKLGDVCISIGIEREVYDVGRAIAESRKPKERWEAHAYGNACWCVRNQMNRHIHSTGTEAQCRAVAEALNKLEAR